MQYVYILQLQLLEEAPFEKRVLFIIIHQFFEYVLVSCWEESLYKIIMYVATIGISNNENTKQWNDTPEIRMSINITFVYFTPWRTPLYSEYFNLALAMKFSFTAPQCVMIHKYCVDTDSRQRSYYVGKYKRLVCSHTYIPWEQKWVEQKTFPCF